MQTWKRAGPVLVLVTVVGLSGCSGVSDSVPGAEPDSTESLEVTLKSDDSTSTVAPVCVEDSPEDLTACAGAPQNIGKVELDGTRKATLQLSSEVSSGGYRLRVNGRPVPGAEGVLNDKVQPFQIPAEVVAAPGETVVTVEALMTPSHPIAVWQFLVSDPQGPPT